MTALDVLAQARAAGLELTPDGNRIRYRGPRGALTPELKAALQAHKPDLLALLTTPENDGRTCDDCGQAATVLMVTDYGCRYCRRCIGWPTKERARA